MADSSRRTTHGELLWKNDSHCCLHLCTVDCNALLVYFLLRNTHAYESRASALHCVVMVMMAASKVNSNTMEGGGVN